jgi:hypothetical protein
MCGAVNRAAEGDLKNEYEVPLPVICPWLNDLRKKRVFFSLVGQSSYLLTLSHILPYANSL